MRLRGGKVMGYFFNFKELVYNFSSVYLQFLINLTPFKRIVALPTKGIERIVLVLKPFTFHNFQSGHPVTLEID